MVTNLILSGRRFIPIDPVDIKVYQCGPTVYAAPHLGNLRSAVVFDVLHRLLKTVYGSTSVRFVRNYTDIDDKIIHKSVEQSVPIGHITQKSIALYERDTRSLGVLDPLRPRATETIPEIIDMILRIVNKGVAYVSEGHVLFDRIVFPNFILNSNLDSSSMREGEGMGYKRNPADFVLWKPSTMEQPGWDSPWGRGRPGWHIECSAMIEKILGSHIDIHCGGIDLRFPHHENECAQTTSLTGQPLSNYWLHNGMLEVEGKMSKSRGNVLYLEDALKVASPMGVRYFLLRGKYSEPLKLDSSMKFLEESETSFRRLERAHRRVQDIPACGGLDEIMNDLATPEALARAHYLATLINGSTAVNKDLKAEFRGILHVLGLDRIRDTEADKETQMLVEARNQARLQRNFTEADRIRDILVQTGYEISDTSI